MGRVLPCVALVGFLAIGAPSSAAELPVRQVLLLQSFDRGSLVIDHFTTNFRVELDQRVGRPVNILQVVVGPTGFVGPSEDAVVDYIRSIYSNRPKPDLIISVAGPAAVFARQHRQQLFPETPLLLASVDEKYLREGPVVVNEASIPVASDFPGLVDQILGVLPDTRQVFMVMGSGELGEFWRRELDEAFKRFHDRVTFIWSGDLSLAEILQRCANLPRHSAIFYFTFGTDASGAAYADERVLADLHATANAPIFGAQSVYLGSGIVGGSLMSIDELSRKTADAATRVLNGAPLGSIQVPVQKLGPPVFDWRELRRWSIPESRLPTGSIVRYRDPGLWEEFKGTVLVAVAVLAVQSLLIVGLLYERRARQHAEIASRRNLALAADASRRATMSTLTSTIIHELSQPLNSMAFNTHALQMMVTASSATPAATQEILADIHSQIVRSSQIIDRHRTMLRSREVEEQPVDVHAAIHETLALVAHDRRARDIAVDVDLPPAPCIVIGDRVLLEQVLMNLVINALDAMAETPPARRRLTIRSEVAGDVVKVSVRDAGTGLPPQIKDAVFTPYVTTKANGMGIGLTIAQTIVEAHGGKIDARDNAEGGATFTVTLHRSEAAAAETAQL